MADYDVDLQTLERSRRMDAELDKWEKCHNVSFLRPFPVVSLAEQYAISMCIMLTLAAILVSSRVYRMHIRSKIKAMSYQSRCISRMVAILAYPFNLGILTLIIDTFWFTGVDEICFPDLGANIQVVEVVYVIVTMVMVEIFGCIIFDALPFHVARDDLEANTERPKEKNDELATRSSRSIAREHSWTCNGHGTAKLLG